jgi:hypothetical protein
MIKCLILLNQIILIAKIEQVNAELGEPDCKLTDVYVLNSDGSVSKWLDITTDDIMLRSENILTIVEPTVEVIAKYSEALK